MQYFAAILALAATAVMAAPAAPATSNGDVFVMNSTACACVNGEGRPASEDICSANGGRHVYFGEGTPKGYADFVSLFAHDPELALGTLLIPGTPPTKI